MKKEQERHDKEPGSNGPHTAAKASHPAEKDLQRFMAGRLTPEEVRGIVRHLLGGCPICTRETRKLWRFGEERPQLMAARPVLPVGVWR
jgi:hypothetical protein